MNAVYSLFTQHIPPEIRAIALKAVTTKSVGQLAHQCWTDLHGHDCPVRAAARAVEACHNRVLDHGMPSQSIEDNLAKTRKVAEILMVTMEQCFLALNSWDVSSHEERCVVHQQLKAYFAQISRPAGIPPSVAGSRAKELVTLTCFLILFLF